MVTRSISGHLTEGMQRHYSTVSGDEQRQALAKVINLTRLHEARSRHLGGGEQPAESGEQKQRPDEHLLIPALVFASICGAETGFRTGDVNLGKVALYH